MGSQSELKAGSELSTGICLSLLLTAQCDQLPQVPACHALPTTASSDCDQNKTLLPSLSNLSDTLLHQRAKQPTQEVRAIYYSSITFHKLEGVIKTESKSGQKHGVTWIKLLGFLSGMNCNGCRNQDSLDSVYMKWSLLGEKELTQKTSSVPAPGRQTLPP